MPRILEKEDLLKNVVDASRLDRFWLDTIHPSDNGQTLVKFPESLVGYDIQVVYVPIRRSDKATPVKRPFRKTPSTHCASRGRFLTRRSFQCLIVSRIADGKWRWRKIPPRYLRHLRDAQTTTKSAVVKMAGGSSSGRSVCFGYYHRRVA